MRLRTRRWSRAVSLVEPLDRGGGLEVDRGAGTRDRVRGAASASAASVAAGVVVGDRRRASRTLRSVSATARRNVRLRGANGFGSSKCALARPGASEVGRAEPEDLAARAEHQQPAAAAAALVLEHDRPAAAATGREHVARAQTVERVGGAPPARRVAAGRRRPRAGAPGTRRRRRARTRPPRAGVASSSSLRSSCRSRPTTSRSARYCANDRLSRWCAVSGS